jgi:CRISPR/Cas system-associated exonuclease Cas4 (RecB family)|tara:strand:- start:172 stop:324 length:153 start_codon:yes stop_codon:yes gene_type:complete
MPKVTIEVELTEERVQRVLEMFEEMDKTLAEMRQISQELKSVTETLSDES